MIDKIIFKILFKLRDSLMSLYCVIYFPHVFSVFCYSSRGGEGECKAKEGNPFGPFWDTFDIDFDEDVFYGPLYYDTENKQSADKWKEKSVIFLFVQHLQYGLQTGYTKCVDLVECMLYLYLSLPKRFKINA